MSDWSDRMLATEATKAGSADEDTRLIPSPPSRTGRLHVVGCFCSLQIAFSALTLLVGQ